MRAGYLLSGMSLFLMSAAVARAEPPADSSGKPKGTVLYTAHVIVNEAEVRSGPSDKPEMYPTHKLRRGEKVEVVEVRQDGWLAIKPPPNSYSWVNRRDVSKLSGQQWVVENLAGATVLIGSALRNEKPTVEGPKLARGTQLTAVGGLLTDESGMWLPIMPPPTEVRYVRATDISKGEPILQPGLASPQPPPAGGNQTQPVSRSTQPPSGSDPLFLQAQEAERSGRIRDAIRLYYECGRKVQNSNNQFAHQCYNRASWLQNNLTASTGGRQTPTCSYSCSSSPACYVPAPICPPYCVNPSSYGPPRQFHRSNYELIKPVQTTQRGRLRTTLRKDLPSGSFALCKQNGEIVAYVAAPASLNLFNLVGRTVEVSGQMVYDTGLRSNYMTAERVIPLE